MLSCVSCAVRIMSQMNREAALATYDMRTTPACRNCVSQRSDTTSPAGKTSGANVVHASGVHDFSNSASHCCNSVDGATTSVPQSQPATRGRAAIIEAAQSVFPMPISSATTPPRTIGGESAPIRSSPSIGEYLPRDVNNINTRSCNSYLGAFRMKRSSNPLDQHQPP